MKNRTKTAVVIGSLYAAVCSAVIAQETNPAVADSTENTPNTTMANDAAVDQNNTGDVKQDEPVQLDEYHVSAVKDFAGGQLAPEEKIGFLGNIKIMDAPFSASRYTSTLLENQHARTIADVMINDPSARAGMGFGNFEETFYIRGYPLFNSDIAFSGLYGALPRQVIATEMIDSVEILKGTSAFVNGIAPGSSGIGGNINIQPKRAPDAPLTRLTGDFSNDSFFGGHVDVGRRFGENKEFGVRLNGVYRDGETAIKNENRQQGLLSLGVDYTTDNVRLSMDLAYQNYRIDQGRNVVFVTTFPNDRLPHAPNGNQNYAQEWTYSHMESYFGMINAEVDVTDWLTVYAGVGGATDEEYGAYSSPYIFNDAGDANAGLLEVPYKDNNYSYEFGLRSKFETGPLKHSVNVGYAETHLKKRAAYEMSSRIYSTNMYRPNQFGKPTPVFAGGNMDSPGVTGLTSTNSVAIADVVSFFEDRINVIGGVRYQKIRNAGYSYAGVKDSSYNEDAFTPGGGIVVKPWQNVSFYMNYMEGLQQGPTAPTASVNAGEIFDPYRSQQYEFGAKIELGAFLGTISFFQIAQPVGVTDPITNHYDVDGETRNRGIEISGVGEVWDGIRLLGGVMFIDSKLRGMKNSATNGNDAFGVPDFTMNIGAEWDTPFVDGMTLTMRSIYTADQYADANNDIEVPSWIRWDVGVRYRFTLGNIPMTLRANIDNVFDKQYWSSAGSTYGGYVSIGAPRTYLMSITMDF